MDSMQLTIRWVDRVQSSVGSQSTRCDLLTSRSIPVEQAGRQRHLLHVFVIVVQKFHHQHGLYEAEHQQSHAHRKKHACA